MRTEYKNYEFGGNSHGCRNVIVGRIMLHIKKDHHIIESYNRAIAKG